MGITGLIPFIEKASRRANINEFSGSTVAIDSYCWLHKGAFACADKLVRGEETDIHIRYCLKYVTMLLSNNIKPILVFDGRHLPAKAMTELKRRESRDISRKRAAELLSLGKTEEARSYMRRSVDITHAMALQLIKECRNRNVDCIVAPYEADSQLAYLNVKNIAHLVITEDSDLILFGCTKVMFKLDFNGTGTLVETAKLPLVMKCPIERYSFEKFRQMCIMSGCDYLASLPGIGLAKARQFVTATQDPVFANALKKLPGFFNRSNLVVTDEYREGFLKAEATFKHQYVYDPIKRRMCRLEDPDDSDVETALCVNAGELLDPKVAFQLALGNLDPFTLKKMDDWDPDNRDINRDNIKTSNWKDRGVAPHPSIWNPDFINYSGKTSPWKKEVKQPEEIISTKTRPRKNVVNLDTKYVPETQDQEESLSIETLSNISITPDLKPELEKTSPILLNKGKSFRKRLKNGSYCVLKQLSRFPRTILDENVIESKFFSTDNDRNKISPCKESLGDALDEKAGTSPNKNLGDSPTKTENTHNQNDILINSTDASVVIIDDPVDKIICLDKSTDSALSFSEELESSQKENSPVKTPRRENVSPVLPSPRNPFRKQNQDSQDSVIECTYPMEQLVTPVDTQESFGESPQKVSQSLSQFTFTNNVRNTKKGTCKVPGLKKKALPSNQPTLLNMFGFQKKPVLRK
ncbi:unnamed protein product [Leptosia nina]|uniref:Exonuclease 1 n=1 Tax=Leptosia nina TaxID=320188 RepID=A0AAV1JQW2_9NEOP